MVTGVQTSKTQNEKSSNRLDEPPGTGPPTDPIRSCRYCGAADHVVAGCQEFRVLRFEDKTQRLHTRVAESIKLRDGHYEIDLPFKNKEVHFPDNYSLAYKRLTELKKRMEKDIQFHQEYTAFIEKVCEKGYAEAIPGDEPEPSNGHKWYIPHHGVYHPKKKKLRVWISELPRLTEISIPRCYKPCDFDAVTSSQLHIFADASNQGYGVAAYLIMSKARVAPLKRVTIPRLELTAACVGVRLAHIIKKELQYELNKTFFWTDSISTIRYIQNESSRFRTFVANRTEVIRDGSQPRQWQYIPTQLNPTDAASRALNYDEFIQMDQWFHGPSFLWNPESKWPSHTELPEISPDDPEVKKTVNAAVTSKCIESVERLLNYSSSWMKLKRVVSVYLLLKETLQRKVHEKQNLNSQHEHEDCTLPAKEATYFSVLMFHKAEIAIIHERAVHLEVAFTLDTNSCINAFRCFFARRGYPKRIRSDNGTNLVGCEKEMREEIKRWNLHQINKVCTQRDVVWEFSPPSGSHHGGIWERMIRTIRRILYSLLHDQVVHSDDEGLQTVFCEVESTINNRPITTVSSDLRDLTPSTPNHLLLLHGNQLMPPGLFCKDECYARKRWRQIQYIADVFWRRWSREYITMQQERQKWTREQKNVAVNDIVLVMDNLPRNAWCLGRILEVFPDKKGHVRVVVVKTQNATLRRPVDKLCVITENDDIKK
ncbi:uncharacterized protein [Haliotis asinina]|uniref:uncharacterized protein n=1 Tax=Haliotis asinina TaxID=109174 RepID=UPI003531F2AA